MKSTRSTREDCTKSPRNASEGCMSITKSTSEDCIKSARGTSEDCLRSTSEDCIKSTRSEDVTYSDLTSHYNTTLAENLRKYPLLPPCRCRKHCYKLFTEQSRTQIHRSFWTLDHFSRGVWIFNHIAKKPVSKLKKPTKSGTNRSCTRAYYLETSCKVNNPEIVSVCQRFFLSTLGYKSDKVITYTLKLFKDVDEQSKLGPRKIKSDCSPDSAPTLRPSTIPHSSETHPILPPCNCLQECIDKIGEEERKQIHKQYWDMSYSDRKHWIYSCIKSFPTQRKTGCKGKSRRVCTRQYFLPVSSGDNVCVCLKFFLSTLGYNNDKIIVHTINALSNPGSSELANSGRKSKNKLNMKTVDLMMKHIKSKSSEFKKLSVKKIYEDFISNHPRLSKKPSYETYRLLVVKMNVRDGLKRRSKTAVDSPAEFKGKTELDPDELHYFEDLELYSPNAGLSYPSYLEQLTSSNFPVEIPLQFPNEPKSVPSPLPDATEQPHSSRQSNRTHQFLVMPGNGLAMGHLVTNDNLIML